MRLHTSNVSGIDVFGLHTNSDKYESIKQAGYFEFKV